MSDRVAVLFANDAFYAAFAGRNIAAMADVWSKHTAVTCIHPGWAPLFGRDAVLRSWQGILGNPRAPRIECLQPTAAMLGSAASVICYERVDNSFLIASNLFVLEDRLWKMVHHHAAPAPAPDVEAVSEPPAPVQ